VAAKEWGLVSLGWVEEWRSGVEEAGKAGGQTATKKSWSTWRGRHGVGGEEEPRKEAKGKPGSPTWWNENDDDDWVVVVVGASATALW
jgi:hypothetical protein